MHPQTLLNARGFFAKIGVSHAQGNHSKDPSWVSEVLERPVAVNAARCGNLIRKPWAFIRVPYMNPTILVL